MILANLLLLVLGQMVAGSISTLSKPVTLSNQPQILYSATIYADGRPTVVHIDNLPSSQETKVQTGTPMSESEVYPFIGALGDIQFESNGDGSYGVTYNYICTASLIDKQTILTAGHCNSDLPSSKQRIYLRNLSDVRVDNAEDYQKKKDKWIAVTSLKTHPKYKKTPTIVYDISVGRLEKPLEAAGVSPICLAEKEYTSKIIGAGWGLKDCYTASEETLRKANGKVYSTSECIELGAGDGLSDLHVCATFTLDNGEPAAVAPGDSGGPLVSFADPNRPVQIGVLSYGNVAGSGDDDAMCVAKDVPQVYGRVSSMKSFINSIATESQWC